MMENYSMDTQNQILPISQFFYQRVLTPESSFGTDLESEIFQQPRNTLVNPKPFQDPNSLMKKPGVTEQDKKPEKP